MEKTIHVFRSDRLRKCVPLDDLTAAQFVNGFYKTDNEKIAKKIIKLSENPSSEIVYVNSLKNLNEAEAILASARSTAVSGLRSTDNT